MSLSKSLEQIICDRWPCLVGARFEPTAQGLSNTTYFAYTDDEQYVVKLYAATTGLAQIHYEHKLLVFLQATDLPCAIPVPIAAATGQSLITVDLDGRSLTITLVPRLFGQTMDRQNLAQVRSAGTVLAQLHHQLQQFNPPDDLIRLPSWGDLAHIHPLVPDPLSVAAILSLGYEEQKYFNQMLEQAMVLAPHLYATLPVQTIHADYITENILVENDRVTGILDFEFSTRDLRLLDYFSSLSQFASLPWKDDQFAAIITAFSDGYGCTQSLTMAEKKASIDVWKLQHASALIYWIGWFIEGKVSHQKIVDAVVATLKFDAWIESNQGQLFDALGFV
jgi:homoserine kinase type II